MFVNTDYFRESALRFLKKGYYCEAPIGTKDYYDFWDEEKKRSINGYQVGDVKITGYHYWYLNYCQILRIPENVIITKSRSKKVDKVQDFPAFWDGDYNWFWLIDIARSGISLQELDKLNLMYRIHPDYLDGGHHLSLTKTRGRGYSYKAASMLNRNYHLGKKSINYAFAIDEEYLVGDALLDKTWANINFINKHTAFAQPFIVDQSLHKKAGFSEKNPITGIYDEHGLLNEVIGLSFHNNPDKGRGKRGELIFFEEAGKFRNLIKSWEVTRPSVEQGGYVSGQMIAFGTGGSKSDDIEGLEELSYNPEAYNCLPLLNEWDEELSGTYCSVFMPVSCNMEMYQDRHGNSNRLEATEHENREREKKKNGKREAYDQYIAENPLTLSEALMQTFNSIMPIKELKSQESYVKAHHLNNLYTYGHFERVDGVIKFVHDPNGQEYFIDKFPHSPDDTIDGCIAVLELPHLVNDVVPNDMYYTIHDPYALEDASDKTSLGAAYVIKRTNNISHTFNELPICGWVGRPKSQDYYNEQLFMMAEFYNSKIGFENDRGDVIGFARRKKKLNMLQEEFQFEYKKELQSSVQRNWGCHMTGERKKQGLLYLRDWLMEVVSVKEGKEYYRYQFIYDIPLLRELYKYNDKGNFDRISALIIGMFYKKEIETKPVTSGKRNKRIEFLKSVGYATTT